MTPKDLKNRFDEMMRNTTDEELVEEFSKSFTGESPCDYSHMDVTGAAIDMMSAAQEIDKLGEAFSIMFNGDVWRISFEKQ